MPLNRGENFKTLLPLQIAAKSFETCPEFSYQWPSQSCVGDFWNFEFPIFQNFKFTIVAYRKTKNLNYLENERS